ncbi:MAG: hypothetical protein JXR03_12235 [Cyclobacteriaceae bacterium]
MKGTLKLIAGLTILSLAISCSDDEPKVDPIVGLWELDDASREVTQSDFEYLNFSGDNDIVGESKYTIEFTSDLKFERILEDVPFTNGTTDDIEEEGEWEIDGDDLDLDADDDEFSGLPYSFKIIENTGSKLTFEYEENGTAFPQTKVTEWFNDGTLDSNGSFTVTDDQFDSLSTNFSQSIDVVYTLEFDKQ